MKKDRRGAEAPAFVNIIPATIDPRIFRKLESLCSVAIQCSQNHQQVRDGIASLNMELRKVSGEVLGHDGVDIMALTQLLKRTDPQKPYQHVPPAPDRDPIDVLEKQGHIDSYQLNAAECIREVWKAFSRCLIVSGRGYDRGGGGMRRATALQPLDVMGDETWRVYKDIFQPWYRRAKEQKVGCASTGNVTKLQIVMRVVIDEYFPQQVDKFMFLDEGTALRVLRGQLSRFFNPEPFASQPEAGAQPGSVVRMVVHTGDGRAAA